jgi:hydroxymethylglutaryl-CoA lyase
MPNTLPARVFMTEVGPRDGLQNEQAPLATAVKVELCERLLAAGVSQLEVTSFVSPKWVPQMADAADVLARLPRCPGLTLSALAPNLKGFEAALASRVDEVVIFGAASEAFSMRNTNCSVAESIERFRPVAQAARAHGLRLRAVISVAFGCPYQGDVPLESVIDLVRRTRDLGCDEIGIADTIGVATAGHVKQVFEAAAREVPLTRLSGHFHDTYGQAVANVYACLEVGVHRFDSAVAGLGGCPYAKGATGNVATEDLLWLFKGLGIDTGLNLDAMVQTGQWISGQVGRRYGSRVGAALAARGERKAGAEVHA